MQLFAAWSVHDGQVLGSCRDGKKFADFQQFLSQQLLAEAVKRKVKCVRLILDNGPTHAPRQLQKWLDGEVKRQGLDLAVKAHWLPVRASWLDQIEIWFSQLQRRVLVPNDFKNKA